MCLIKTMDPFVSCVIWSTLCLSNLLSVKLIRTDWEFFSALPWLKVISWSDGWLPFKCSHLQVATSLCEDNVGRWGKSTNSNKLNENHWSGSPNCSLEILPNVFLIERAHCHCILWILVFEQVGINDMQVCTVNAMVMEFPTNKNT